MSLPERIASKIDRTDINARKTHCIQGHPLSGDNLYLTDRQRACRLCRRDAVRRYAARGRAA